MKPFLNIFTFIGIAFLVGAVFAYRYTKNFLDNAETAQGVVTELTFKRSKSGGSYYPTVRFTAKDGTTYTATSTSGSRPPSYEVGEAVQIRYNPANPTDIEMPGFFDTWGLTLVLGGVGQPLPS